jgi:3-methylcrotonyl-CoA carboxylase alpha subunit
MIKKLLIANRGEIACRIIKSAKKIGITTVAVYCDEEKNPLHVTLADESYSLGPLPLENSYLNQEKIIALAKSINSDAIHPGYGFLSENHLFAKLCSNNNIIFVGPSSESISLMGKKDEAKISLNKIGVPVIPGYNGKSQQEDTLIKEAMKIGLPVLIKATAGGGGKGMRKVFSEDEIAPAIQAAKREALNSFGDDTLIIEKYLTNVRHIEVQVMRDSHGNNFHLFERDCSIQRRHQKIIEEAPAPVKISEKIQKELFSTSLKISSAIDYQGVGTIEYLYSDDKFYFLEMNTRIQVEHSVTEMITGIDLVECQIQIANGDSLELKQEDIQVNGHSIEARIYAEDPDNGFLPTTGKLHKLITPKENINIRLDTGVRTGDEIGIYFDPMIAKLTVHAKNRLGAIEILSDCLHKFSTLGVKSNIDFLSNLLTNKDYTNANIYTNTLDSDLSKYLQSKPYDKESLSILACIYHAHTTKKQDKPSSIWNRLQNWRLNHAFATKYRLKINNTIETVLVKETNDLIIVNPENSSVEYYFNMNLEDNLAVFAINNTQANAKYAVHQKNIWVSWLGNNFAAKIQPMQDNKNINKKENAQVQSPMPGIIRDIFVKTDQNVKKGQKLIALEAMKMEHTLLAMCDGKIKTVHNKIGDQVEQGKELIAFHV